MMKTPRDTFSKFAIVPRCEAFCLNRKRCTDHAVGMIAGQTPACYTHWHAYFNQYRTKPLRFIRKASK